MANLTTVHHININIDDVISVNCPVCKCHRMFRDQEKTSYWTCDNGHEFYVDLYESSAKALNLRLMFLRGESK
jgi:hypothetical protein